MSQRTLSGSVALVTGGHRRVGWAIARALAERGCAIHLTWRRSRQAADRAVESLRALGVEAAAHRVDLAVPGEVAGLADRVWDATGRVDVLVNNASIYPRTPLAAVTERDWDACHAVNVKAPFLLSQSLGLRMRAAGGGAVVNVVDWAVERPYRDYLPYFASKAGLLAITRALALELAPEVRVNAVSPGPVMLPEDTTDAERAAIVARTPLGREGSPEDVAGAVVFLVEGTGFATGAVVHVDGGRHLET